MNNFFKNFWFNNMDIYKHIFISTNDYNEDISYLQNKLNNISNINHFITVSGGWFFLLSSIPTSNILKNIIIFDINPNMLYIYNLIYHIFIISPNINSFLSNIFCRNVDDYNIFKTNQDVINYMNKNYDINIYNKVKKQLKKYGLNGKLALMIYKTIIKKHILNLTNDHKDTNTIPTYYYDKNNFKIFDKKLHTTQNINDSSHYFTTFYVNILEPFITNNSYNNVRNHLLISNVSFRLFDLNILSLNNFTNLINKFDKNDNICIYIDGIDMDYFTYLNMNRSNLFKIFLEILKKYELDKFYILSSKSGLSIIDKKNIIYDDYYIKNKNIEIKDKPLLDNYKSIEYTKYDKEYINKLNNDLSNNLIKSYRYNKFYKIFRLLPKPCNPHIHFSTIVSYNKILNIIHNITKDYPNIYIKFKNEKIYLGFENDEINNNNSELYNKDKHHLQIINYINDHNDINKFDKINIIGDMFYNIIKYKKFYIEYYLPNIINYMNKHNVYFMNIRLLLGTVFDIKNKKRDYLTYNEELDLLYEYRDKFNIIISFSKCKDHKIIINNITNICEIMKKNEKYREIIIGYDLIGDENICNEINNLIEPLLNIKNKYNINYYIHAGEFINSNKSFNNLNNVFKLEPIRIGHASYYIVNNNIVDYYINNRNILFELCPISNYFYHKTIYNNNNFIRLLNLIVIGSDDDNKLISNLSIDYMFLYFYYKLDILQLKQLLLNSLKCIPDHIIKKYDIVNLFNKNFDSFSKLL